MKNRKYVWLLSLAMFASCKTHLGISNIKPYENTKITADLAEDQEMVKTIIPYKKSMESQMNEKISHTSVALTKDGDDSNMGKVLVDYTYDAAAEWAKSNGLPRVDAAVINIGGIRTTFAPGDILLKHIFEVMPFENEIVIIAMKGSDLQGLFDYYLKTQVNNPVSHLSIETENGKLTKALINGEVPIADKTYYIATTDYLALGGDRMWYFGKGKMIPTGLKLREVFIESFRKNPEVSVPTDVRLRFNK